MQGCQIRRLEWIQHFIIIIMLFLDCQIFKDYQRKSEHEEIFCHVLAEWGNRDVI